MVAVAARRDFAAALAACGEAVRLGLDGRRLAADGLQPPATAGVGTTLTGYARSAGHELRLAITGKRRRCTPARACRSSCCASALSAFLLFHGRCFLACVRPLFGYS